MATNGILLGQNNNTGQYISKYNGFGKNLTIDSQFLLELPGTSDSWFDIYHNPHENHTYEIYCANEDDEIYGGLCMNCDRGSLFEDFLTVNFYDGEGEGTNFSQGTTPYKYSLYGQHNLNLLKKDIGIYNYVLKSDNPITLLHKSPQTLSAGNTLNPAAAYEDKFTLSYTEWKKYRFIKAYFGIGDSGNNRIYFGSPTNNSSTQYYAYGAKNGAQGGMITMEITITYPELNNDYDQSFPAISCSDNSIEFYKSKNNTSAINKDEIWFDTAYGSLMFGITGTNSTSGVLTVIGYPW